MRVGIKVKCQEGKSDQKQGANKISNTSPWTICEDKDHRLYLCRKV